MSGVADAGAGRVRLDKWLWAARFFKTRALATEAVSGGHVHVGGERVKPARSLHPGDRLDITRGHERFEVIVRALSEQRGPASVAQTLYEETAASRSRREHEAEQHRLQALANPRPDARPDKQARRRILRFVREGGG
ncbi:RNA-binding S4 domain-containing protein [Plasticicumulans sp.]|uniref:RNA-binding S4 domain-containing protein n=1 Tax=Plasticicumulans sp. TaxID=2307179 RepID=UPI002C602040|nr:S4 domain-containing protein [Plasticicumulans sp.]MBS0600233.1 RNA-binding protein [Pseudomonadota bacterium]HMV40392.1 S4 domain-containing protein [Plasticicumulans sp.]HMW30460.1 S4 domain-containing protein [Plasticicumulans sp.]HMW42391.1 S4 domain-containing protein [Plasticicumulans sp.]HMZ11986.1 S4 domain-containing protein [Plasticicumulans sp.]